jgi:hypothetical protein
MTEIGTVREVWRYPVKSMRGETMNEAFMGFSGIYGDRCAAYIRQDGKAGFPYLSASAQEQMLRYQPVFRHPERAVLPPHLAESAGMEPGLTPLNGDPDDLSMDIVTPSGTRFDPSDVELVAMLRQGIHGEPALRLVRSDRALTDCRPVSLISMRTVETVGSDSGIPMDRRRFRANVYVDLAANRGFAEDELIGRRIRIGRRGVLSVLERDPRCKILSLDPDTSAHSPEVLRSVARSHSACAGVYCAVLVEGIIAKGDTLTLLD